MSQEHPCLDGYVPELTVLAASKDRVVKPSAVVAQTMDTRVDVSVVQDLERAGGG